MQSVKQQFEAEHRVKGSTFLSFINPCDSPGHGDSVITKIRDSHPSATHHCYAFRVHPNRCIELSQDDGEPGGTAGLPILNTLRSFDLINLICIVVRYYGGKKLGKSGLIDAYSTATRIAIERADLKTIVSTTRFLISYPYDQQALIDKLRHTYTLFEINADYTEKVRLVVECIDEEVQAFEKRLQSIDHLLHEFEKLEKSYQLRE